MWAGLLSILISLVVRLVGVIRHLLTQQGHNYQTEHTIPHNTSAKSDFQLKCIAVSSGMKCSLQGYPSLPMCTQHTQGHTSVIHYTCIHQCLQTRYNLCSKSPCYIPSTLPLSVLLVRSCRPAGWTLTPFLDWWSHWKASMSSLCHC